MPWWWAVLSFQVCSSIFSIQKNAHIKRKLSHEHHFTCSRSTQLSFLSEDNTRDQKMVDFMVEKWTNFAIYHNPTPLDNIWPPYGSNGITYVRLNDSKIIVQNDKVRDDRLRFWTQIRNRIDWIVNITRLIKIFPCVQGIPVQWFYPVTLACNFNIVT